jgi:hypothetical protein
VWVSGDSDGLKNTEEDTVMYLDLGFRSPTSGCFFVFKNTQNGGVITKEKRFGRDRSVLS